jgi:hypothetical protein
LKPADVVFALELPNQINQRREGDRVPADMDTAAEVSRRLRDSCRLGEQRGLPDAWVTADQNDSRLTFGGSGNGPLKHRELVVAPDYWMFAASAHSSAVFRAGESGGAPRHI